jgi:hypothetical protein
LGNKALHEMSIPSKDELKIAIDIIVNILESIYEIPYKGNRLKQAQNSR